MDIPLNKIIISNNLTVNTDKISVLRYVNILLLL